MYDILCRVLLPKAIVLHIIYSIYQYHHSRTGYTNNNPGNIKWRISVEILKPEYKSASKDNKAHIAMSVVREWRALEPPGRFLKRDDTGLWYDIGDVDARAKCSQILREHNSTKLKLDEYGNSCVSTTTSTKSDQPKAPRKQAGKELTQKQLPRKRSLSRQHSNKHTNRKKMNRVDSITTDSDEGRPSLTSEPRQDEPSALALEWDRILTAFEEDYAKRNNSNDTIVPMDESTDESSQRATSLQSLESTSQSTTTSLTTQSTTKPPSEEQAIPVRTTQLQCSHLPLATVKMAKLRRSKQAETETTTAELLDNTDSESSLNMNDVLMGANYNSHPGNIQFFKALSMFDNFSAVSDCYINALESLDPPGRFMGKDKLTNCWESLDYETAIELVPYLADSYTQNSNDGDECSSAFILSVQQFLEAKQEGGTDSNGSISELTDPTYQKAVLPQTSPIPREVKCSPKRSSTSKQLRKMPITSLRIGTIPRNDESKNEKKSYQMFEVVVPGGVSSGQTFSLLADGQRVTLICPETAKPGGKVRFRLPIPETATTPKKACQDTFDVASRALTSTRHGGAQKRMRVAKKGKSLALSAALDECEGKNEVTDSSTRDSISYETYAEA